MRLTSHGQAKNDGKEQAKYSLDELNRPDEVDDEAETWEDVDKDKLRQELGEASSRFVTEQLDGLVTEHAIKHYLDELPRVTMDDLTYEDKEEALVDGGIWPNEMREDDARNILWENQEAVTGDAFSWAHEAVSAGVFEVLNPLDEDV